MRTLQEQAEILLAGGLPSAHFRKMLSQPQVVLVVEDEWLIRDTLVEVLTQAGFRVLEAEQGETALTTLQEHGPDIDLLFTDTSERIFQLMRLIGFRRGLIV